MIVAVVFMSAGILILLWLCWQLFRDLRYLRDYERSLRVERMQERAAQNGTRPRTGNVDNIHTL